MTTLEIQHFFHPGSSTLSYVVTDSASSAAAVIDPVLGYNAASGRTDPTIAEEIVSYLRRQNLRLEWILETHAHADHLSGAQYIRAQAGGRIGIGAGILEVQKRFADIYNLKPPFRADGRQFDRLFDDGETFAIGGLSVSVLATPGHTSDSITYCIADAAFVGDSLFMPDYGTARCDFPGGDAGRLYDSIQALLALPSVTRLYMCHDYQPGGRELRFATTVAEQAAANIHIGNGRVRDEFVRMREARDATLTMPALLLPSIQVNIRAGALPPPDDNDIAYLRIPLNLL